MSDENPNQEINLEDPKLLAPIEEALKESPNALNLVKGIVDVANKVRAANKDLDGKYRSTKVELENVKSKQNVVPKAEYNTLESRFAELEANFNKSQAETKAEKQRNARSDLKSTVISEAARLGAFDPEDVFHLMEARGLVGLKEEDNSHIFIKKEGGKDFAVISTDAVKHFLDSKPELVKGSDANGSGSKDKTSGVKSGSDVFLNPVDAASRFMQAGIQS